MLRVVYLDHSGFMVETDKRICIFDYYRGQIPHLDPGKEIYVFVSHAHYDHYNPEILSWKEENPGIWYIISEDVNIKDQGGRFLFVKPRQDYTVNGMKIHTLKSTDQGVAFLVETENRRIYHAGDLNWWHWEEEGRIFNEMMSRKYRAEIDKLKGASVDLAFVPLDSRQGDTFYLGMDYFMRQTDTKCVFPMHMCGAYTIIERLLKLKESGPYRGRVMRINKNGQRFQIEGE